MKNALRLTIALPCLCGLILFNTSCGGDHDHDHDGHEGHDHGSEHKDGEEGSGHDHDGKEPAEKTGDESAATPAAADTYPLKVCVVSGEELGSMGEPVVLVHEGTTVKFCCDGCIDDFKEDPAPYLAKLAAATKGQ